MNVAAVLEHSLWAALFATGLGFLLTAPARYLVATFVAGFAGRFVRDAFMAWGMSQNWSTVVAAAVLVLLAVAIVRDHKVPPVVLICGVLPLGAAVAMFNAIVGLMKVSSARDEALSAASVALSANAGKAFTGTLAVALGLAAGMALVRLFTQERKEAVPALG